MEDIELRLREVFLERDYWIAEYHNKDSSKIIRKLNEKLESKDEEIRKLKEDILYLENRLKVIPFKRS